MSWSIESGYSHKCPDCGQVWYDSDGGCDSDYCAELMTRQEALKEMVDEIDDEVEQ